MIELLTALCYLAAFLLFGWSLLTLKVMIFVSFMIVIAIIDLQTKLIPDILSIPGMILGLLLSYQHIIHALIAAAIGFAIIFIIVVVSRGGMGLGDAKLLSMIGAFWGWQSILYTLFLGSLFGSIVGITLLVTHKIERKTHIPFAPFLAMGSVLAMFYVLQVLGIKL